MTKLTSHLLCLSLAALASAPCADAGCLKAVRGLLARAVHAEVSPAERLPQAQALALRYGADVPNAKTQLEVIGAVRKRIEARRLPPLEAADKMAAFGAELDPTLSGLPDADQRAIRFEVAKAVQSLEAFSPAESTGVAPTLLARRPLNFVPFAKVPEYVKGFIDKLAPYSTIDVTGFKGFDHPTVRFRRDVAARNMLALARDHDVHHLQYAASHPRAAAAYFMTARSRSPFRFAFANALFEGVDTHQREHEQRLAEHMAKHLHLDLEEALIFAASAPIAQLKRIAREIHIAAELDSDVKTMAAWSPPAPDASDPNTDLLCAMSDVGKFAADPANARYVSKDHAIHFPE